MPISGLDFGLFIAYFVPGLITLWAISAFVPPLRQLFERLEDDKRFGAILAVAVGALVTGMTISIVRGAVLDPTFGIPYPLVDCNGSPQYGSVKRVDPDYTQLADGGVREAFLLAVSQEKRPYQFYGSTLLSILFLGASWIASGGVGQMTRRRRGLMTTLIVCALLALYGGARMSHYRFMRAVSMLNGQHFDAFNSSGKPCPER